MPAPVTKVTEPKLSKESVVVVNDKNFDSIVLDTTKDVFVEFYANWYSIWGAKMVS
jgi:hypothetical protein